ncbi:MAG: hypothetical protein H6R07_294 [Proteobacteria bacterium]|nr:hypothetical protein [Pseudomonadota bacterium]
MESRITELEIRLALQDELLDTLNRTVAEQQLQIIRLQQELHGLCQHLQALEPAARNLPAQEIPPHY